MLLNFFLASLLNLPKNLSALQKCRTKSVAAAAAAARSEADSRQELRIGHSSTLHCKSMLMCHLLSVLFCLFVFCHFSSPFYSVPATTSVGRLVAVG